MSSPARKRRRQEEGAVDNLFASPTSRRSDGEASCHLSWASKWTQEAVNRLRERKIIISLDLDAFYVAASRKRDPSLVDIPIGIKQKGILATVSYEARALGVHKLATVASGLKQCPQLVLVNGEDLSYFRRLSTRIWRLVCSLLPGCPVEKLGMDELFCDVTDLIDQHLCERKKAVASLGEDATVDSMPFFPLGGPLKFGFHYDLSGTPGNILPQATSLPFHSGLDLYHLRLLVGAHLAAAVRNEIMLKVGLTASAGIAHNKLLAKIVGNVHKPAQQTVFLPSLPSPSLQDVKQSEVYDIQAMLDPMPVRKLNGFGSAVVAKLLGSAPSATSWLANGATEEEADHTPEEKGDPGRVLLVSEARREFSQASFISKLGSQRQGTRLWSLLYGTDDEPVIAAPEYPAQISIEDTYRGLEGAAVQDQLGLLSYNLLRRLETELVSSAEEQLREPTFERNDEFVEVLHGQKTRIRVYEEVETAQAHAPDARWRRYPLGLRLSVRHGWNNRISKQGKMPVGIFDLSHSRTERSAILANAASSLLRSLMPGESSERSEGLNLINIAALELSTQRPAQSISSFLESELHAGRTRMEKAARGAANPEEEMVIATDAMSAQMPSHGGIDDIDPDVLEALPSDVRAEVLAERGLTLDEWYDRLRARRRQEDPDSKDSTHALATLSPAEEAHRGSTTPSQSPKGIRTATKIPEVVCSQCGETTSLWLQHDHDIWPERGVPGPR